MKTDERTRQIPVIFMTVLTRMEDKVKGFEVGGMDYISKPFQKEEVLARVARFRAHYVVVTGGEPMIAPVLRARRVGWGPPRVPQKGRAGSGRGKGRPWRPPLRGLCERRTPSVPVAQVASPTR